MISRIVLGAALALVTVSPGFAGPCTERLATLEKSITAKQEGAGPALKAPTTTGSTSQTSVPSGDQGSSQALQMIQQAKQLDQQGKEAECMDMAKKIGTMAPPATK